jgi:predicted Zn-dependent protease
MFRRLTIPFSLVFVLSFAAGCGHGGAGVLGGSGASVSLDQEWQLGDQLAAQVDQKVQLNRDAQLNAYVRSVGERIHAHTPLAGRPFDFKVINDATVNAFSLPGGHVYINSGLIAQADKADMLAGVMAHEISHVVARHAIKQVEQQQQISVIGSILLGQNPGALESLLANVLAGGAMARFSRADEKEADDLGVGFMSAAGFDAHGMLEMFQKLLSLEQSQPNAVSRFLSDHPTTQSRINDIQARIQGMPPGIVDEPEYQSARRAAM